MAWTTSAGPGRDFALAAWAAALASYRSTALNRPTWSQRALSLPAIAMLHVLSIGTVAASTGEGQLLAIVALTTSLFASSAALILMSGRQSAAQGDTTGAAEAKAAETAPATGSLTTGTPSRETPAPFAITGHSIGHVANRSEIDPHVLSPQTHDELMARVSHELRTPLNAVLGFSDLMGHEMFGPLGHPRYEEYVRHIRESGKKLLKSAEDTLAVTALLAAKPGTIPSHEEVGLALLARDARAALAADALQRDVRIVHEIDADIAVIAPRRALRQVLVNLLAEALSRASEGGEITIAARIGDDKVLLSITTNSTGSPILRDRQASLPMCLARTLLELSGGQLCETCNRDGRWQVSTLLDSAAQPDFFLPSRTSVHATAAVS